MNHLLSSIIRAVAMATSLALFALSPAQAEDGKLQAPKGTPILVIEGNVSVTNGNGVASFDRDMLEALGATTIETTTPWFTGMVKFEGVPLQKIMELVGADGKEVVAVALNDYKTTIPTEDFALHNVLLAIKRDGQYMEVSDKGPMFIVYPYDSKPELQSQKFYSRSVWQLARLIVR